MAAETKTGFTIDGEVYETVSMDDFDTDERFILFEYSGLVQEDFLQEEDESDDDHEARIGKLMRHPGWWPAMWHIAYRRAHPQMKPAKIKELIGRTKWNDAMASLVDETEAEELDPTEPSTSEPPESSGRNSAGSSESSGNPSEPDTGGQVVALAATTDGSSQPSEYPQTTSVA